MAEDETSSAVHPTTAAYEIKRMPIPARQNGSVAPMSNPMYKGDPPYTGAWSDCAYDPELPGPLHHPDQINVPTAIDEVLRLYTKAAIRERPEGTDIYEWSRQWFEDKAQLLAAQQQPAADGATGAAQ